MQNDVLMVLVVVIVAGLLNRYVVREMWPAA